MHYKQLYRDVNEQMQQVEKPACRAPLSSLQLHMPSFLSRLHLSDIDRMSGKQASIIKCISGKMKMQLLSCGCVYVCAEMCKYVYMSVEFFCIGCECTYMYRQNYNLRRAREDDVYVCNNCHSLFRQLGSNYFSHKWQKLYTVSLQDCYL